MYFYASHLNHTLFHRFLAMAKSNGISFSLKLAVIALIMALTLGYSILKKKEISHLVEIGQGPVLKRMPSFSVPYLYGEATAKNLLSEDLFKNGEKGVFIHLWATWCAPCEAELPAFIAFMEKNKGKGLRAVLLAVKDEERLIQKFFKKLGKLPKNIDIVHDKSGILMSTFGVVKIPETYFFAPGGKTLNKFIGPQEWESSLIQNKVDFYLNSASN